MNARNAPRLLRRVNKCEGSRLLLLRRELDRGLEEANAGAFSTRSLDEIAEEILSEKA